jgi:hypothetical protein
LVVGAGSGNDVSAALRGTNVPLDAVEIDPLIVELGRRLHPEQPYADPRVRVVINDARSFFVRTPTRYAKIVFGYLDSHTLRSSFSSLRLDNFVYTRQAMERVKDLLLPGGRVFLTFASDREWMHRRMIALLDSVFDYPTTVIEESVHGYANGIIYVNGKAAAPARPRDAPQLSSAGHIKVPTDDWPFLYMKEPTLPSHYRLFMILIAAMGFGSLLLLPRGQRQVRFSYFFLGAGFFLIETSNVVSLSLRYGSTWTVNVAVFTGILLLVLLGNVACMRMTRPRIGLLFTCLFLSLFLAYLTSPSSLLDIQSPFLQAGLAIGIFLGPVFLASLIFGHLIKTESSLYQAYGSNLLGAVIGGLCEYASIVVGLKSLLLITLGFYFLAFLFVQAGKSRPLPQT